MNMQDRNILPIVYRCDSKYVSFLQNSINSVVKFYKGDRQLKFYICTNDDLIVNLPNTNYEIVKIDEAFLKRNNYPESISKLALRKFCGFNSFDAESDKYNNTTYAFNPFNRSKFITGLWIFLLPVLQYDKVVVLDTDTIIVSDITDLYNIDISKVMLASCLDWIDTDTINPSVATINVQKFKSFFFSYSDEFTKRITNTDYTKYSPFCEVIQQIANEVFLKDCIILDPSWNVPITHMEQYPEPRVYHFSESWVGNEKVITTYDRVVAKYLNEK